MNERGGEREGEKGGRMIVGRGVKKLGGMGKNDSWFVVVWGFEGWGDVFLVLVIVFFRDFGVKFFCRECGCVLV